MVTLSAGGSSWEKDYARRVPDKAPTTDLRLCGNDSGGPIEWPRHPATTLAHEGEVRALILFEAPADGYPLRHQRPKRGATVSKRQCGAGQQGRLGFDHGDQLPCYGLLPLRTARRVLHYNGVIAVVVQGERRLVQCGTEPALHGFHDIGEAYGYMLGMSMNAVLVDRNGSQGRKQLVPTITPASLMALAEDREMLVGRLTTRVLRLIT